MLHCQWTEKKNNVQQLEEGVSVCVGVCEYEPGKFNNTHIVCPHLTSVWKVRRSMAAAD